MTVVLFQVLFPTISVLTISFASVVTVFHCTLIFNLVLALCWIPLQTQPSEFIRAAGAMEEM